MDLFGRRIEIINIIAARHHVTMKELAKRFNVCKGTIRRDIVSLSYLYPIYTKTGYEGGIFIMEGYKPFVNTLSPEELNLLCTMYQKSEGKDKELLFRLLKRYGPDKLEL